MGASKNSRNIKTKGNRAYGLSYALSALKANPFRAITLALTLSLGISLFASTMVWGDTGIFVSMYDYLGNHMYQVQVTSDSGVPQALSQAEAYMGRSRFVEETYRVNSTIGLVWASNISDSWIYDMDNPVYTSGVKDCRVVFVDNEFLNKSAFEFTYEGAFTVGQNEVIVSRMFIAYVEQVFYVTLQINDTIDVDLLTGDVVYLPSGDMSAAPLGMLGRMKLTNLKIVGIFDLRTYDTMIES